MLIYTYHALPSSPTYRFLTYGIQVWGLTYPPYLKPVTTLQKRAVRIMIFSDPRSHSVPLFQSPRLLKFSDMIHLEIFFFVHQWYHKLSPFCFVDYWVSSIHSYYTRQSQNDICLLNRFINHSIPCSFSPLHWYQPLEFFIYWC